MADETVGYRKPPLHTRFRKGVCPNPRGRGNRKAHAAADEIEAFLNGKVSFREGGRQKKAKRLEVSIKRLAASALAGNVKDARRLILLRLRAKSSENRPLVVRVIGGMPDPES